MFGAAKGLFFCCAECILIRQVYDLSKKKKKTLLGESSFLVGVLDVLRDLDEVAEVLNPMVPEQPVHVRLQLGDHLRQLVELGLGDVEVAVGKQVRKWAWVLTRRCRPVAENHHLF